MPFKKNDFVEIEFTARIKDGEMFDSNLKENLQKLNPQENHNKTKPFIFALGQNMFLKGVEDFLIGKDIGSYNIELTPENAFGLRNSELVKMIPSKVFQEHKINPIPGIMFNFDGRMAKILTVSGGRVMVDFNNPLSGKDVIYDINVLRKIGDINDKVKALNEFLFRKDFKFSIKEKKLTLEVNSQMAKFVGLFKDKFKEILNLEIEVKEIKEDKEKTDAKLSKKSQ